MSAIKVNAVAICTIYISYVWLKVHSHAENKTGSYAARCPLTLRGLAVMLYLWSSLVMYAWHRCCRQGICRYGGVDQCVSKAVRLHIARRTGPWGDLPASKGRLKGLAQQQHAHEEQHCAETPGCACLSAFVPLI